MIHLNNVTYFYPLEPDINILDGVDLSLKKGEKLTLVGESGCGKTTLLQIIGGLIKPVKGDISIDAKQITWISQDPLMTSFLTIWDNILLLVEDIDPDKVKQLANRLGLSELLDKYPAELSLGELQRVAILRAVLVQSDLLLVDEPTSSLDEVNKQKVIKLLFDLPTTVVIATHDPAVIATAKFLLRLDRGNLSPLDID